MSKPQSQPSTKSDISAGSSADLRRQQLVQVACEIVESQGVDNLKHSAIAERAGCTRPLVYRYFPKKHDIYVAITADFYEALDRALSFVDQSRVIPEASAGNRQTATHLLETIWELTEKKGLAAISLRCAPMLDLGFSTYLTLVREQFENRWAEGYQALGLSRVDAELLIDNNNCCMRNAFEQVRTGRQDRQTALAKLQLSLAALQRAALHGTKS